MSDLDELLDHYFSLGVAEGKEGRDHDTPTGEAQATRDLIMLKLARLTSPQLHRHGGGVTEYMVERACRVHNVGWSRWHEPQKKTAREVMKSALVAALAQQPLSVPLPSYQDRVAAAHHALFHDDPTDVAERVARFFEEAVETCQAFGLDFADAHHLINYTYDRPVGEPAKEIGAALLTLTSLCVIAGYDLAACGEADLEKLQRPETIARIRAKRSTRHGRGPLPGLDPAHPTQSDVSCSRAREGGTE